MKRVPILHTAVHGNGPTVVLLHGFLSSSGYWRNVVRQLETMYRVVTIDLLGFGDSPKPRLSKYDHAAQLRAIQATLESLNIKEPFILVGHSMGALLALRFSAEHQSRVKKLVLVNMPIILGKKELRREILSKNRINRLGLEYGINRLTWGTLYSLYKLRLLPQKARRLLKGNEYFFRHTAASRVRSFYNVIGSKQVVDDLAAISIPTMMLSGNEDRPLYLRNLREKVLLSPSVQHSVFSTGHHIPWDMPMTVVESIKEI